MKLLMPTELFAGKAMIQFHHRQQASFFTGEQPPADALLTLELPGLKSQGHKAITGWLIEHNRGGKKSAKEDTAIPRSIWRRAVLDDYLDAANATTYVWSVSSYFTLAEIATFAESHGPTFDREVRAALAVDRTKRPAALTKLTKRSERIVPILAAAQHRIPMELEEIKIELDREDVKKLRVAKASIKGWISACADLRSDTVKQELLGAIATRIVGEDADVGAALDQMLEKRLDKLPAAELFATLAHRVPLPPNVTGETIDLTKAREVTVPATWHTYTSRRIGSVRIGRSALFFYDLRDGAYTYTYVRGERKLKHQIARRGGTITRFGNTLTIAAKDPSSVQAALLRVDEIDSLAQLSPTRAAALLGDTAPTAAIMEALAHAPTEPRWRRVLADLLIERIVGIDADVARRLARAEAVANRKRR